MKKFSISAIAMIAAAFAATTADAATVQTSFPGAVCQQSSGGVLARFGGTVLNSSTTSDLNVICPLGAQFGPQRVMDTAATFALVYDRSSTQDVSCTMIGEDPVSGAQTGQLAQTFVTATTNGQNLVAPITINFIGLVRGLSIHMVCSIPRATGSGASDVAFIHLGVK